MRSKSVISSVLLGLILSACKPGTPKQYIQPAEMEEILYDYHIARAMASNARDSVDYRRLLYTEAVLKKHGVTREQFDSSMVYYYSRADRFDKMCRRVTERLEARAVDLGASEGEINRYTKLNANGDTANIWYERDRILLRPNLAANKYCYEIEADSTFRVGDSFLLQFMADYMFQSGSREGVSYLAVTYDRSEEEKKDTVITYSLRFSSVGLQQMRVSTKQWPIKLMRGFFYLGGYEPSSTTRILFITNIQLIRFHQKNAKTVIKKDSIGGTLPADGEVSVTAGSGDSEGPRPKVLPPHGGITPNRMVMHPDTAQN